MEINPGTSPEQIFQGGEWILSRNVTLKENTLFCNLPASHQFIRAKESVQNSDQEEEEMRTNKEHLGCLVTSVYRITLRKRGLAGEVICSGRGGRSSPPQRTLLALLQRSGNSSHRRPVGTRNGFSDSFQRSLAAPQLPLHCLHKDFLRTPSPRRVIMAVYSFPFLEPSQFLSLLSICNVQHTEDGASYGWEY